MIPDPVSDLRQAAAALRLVAMMGQHRLRPIGPGLDRSVHLAAAHPVAVAYIHDPEISKVGAKLQVILSRIRKRSQPTIRRIRLSGVLRLC